MTHRTLSGAKVRIAPSGEGPEKRLIQGARVALEPLDPDRHGEALYIASHESEEARTFEDDRWLRTKVVETDRLFFAFRDKQSRRPGGMAWRCKRLMSARALRRYGSVSSSKASSTSIWS